MNQRKQIINRHLGDIRKESDFRHISNKADRHTKAQLSDNNRSAHRDQLVTLGFWQQINFVTNFKYEYITHPRYTKEDDTDGTGNRHEDMRGKYKILVRKSQEVRPLHRLSVLDGKTISKCILVK
jgi:hypothetical protein